MFQTLLQKLIRKVMPEPSVDGAMSSFNKAVAKLKKVGDHHRAASNRKLEEAAKATSAANVALRESQRADSVVQRLEALSNY